MDNNLSELSKPVAEIRKHYPLGIDAPASAFFQPLEGLSAVNFGDLLYSQEYVSALDRVAQFWIGESAGWKKRAENAEQRVAELEAKLATPVRLPKRWDVSGQVNPPRIVEVQFEQQNRTHDQCAEAIRAAGFTVVVEGGG